MDGGGGLRGLDWRDRDSGRWGEKMGGEAGTMMAIRSATRSDGRYHWKVWKVSIGGRMSCDEFLWGFHGTGKLGTDGGIQSKTTESIVEQHSAMMLHCQSIQQRQCTAVWRSCNRNFQQIPTPLSCQPATSPSSHRG